MAVSPHVISIVRRHSLSMNNSDYERNKDESLSNSSIPYFIFGRPEMDLWRWLSLIVALIYLSIAAFASGVGGVLRTFAFLVIPMACIWFGDEMGDYVGYLGSQSITGKTPGFLVRLGGWLLILSPLWMPLIAGFIRWLN